MQDALKAEHDKSLKRGILAASPRAAAKAEEGQEGERTSRRQQFVVKLTAAAEEVYEVRKQASYSCETGERPVNPGQTTITCLPAQSHEKVRTYLLSQNDPQPSLSALEQLWRRFLPRQARVLHADVWCVGLKNPGLGHATY